MKKSPGDRGFFLVKNETWLTPCRRKGRMSASGNSGGVMLKLIMVVIVAAFVACLLFILGAASVKAGDQIIDFRDLNENDLKVKGFELTERSEIEIETVGARARYNKSYYAYGWIIDAKDRSLVWSMQDDCRDTDRLSGALLECQDEITLPAGMYEAYYYVGSSMQSLKGVSISINDLGDLVELIGDVIEFDDEKFQHERFDEDELAELMFSIRTDTPAHSYSPRFDRSDDVVVEVHLPEENEYHQKGFTLSARTRLDIYAIGEYSDIYELFVDGCWIINAESREKVWAMNKWNSRRAGGAKKNRVCRDDVVLPAGDYIACYATDDSHDPGEWNSPPPTDPMSYGIIITVADKEDMANVSSFKPSDGETEILAITRVRDGSFKKKGLTLKRNARLRIKAIGERNYNDNRLVDYAWIVDADNLDKVWEMTADNTDFAGGAAKNCVFDGIVELPAGNYLVYYRSDDSHAFLEWNAAAPFEPKKYGITIYAAEPGFSESDYALADEFPLGGDILVNLTGLGDGVDVEQDFVISETSRIRIHAIGEGKTSGMFDYGWVENARSGEIVWEMTYRKTRHAGGARKNRMVLANITLDKGKYTAYFVTDDSHSFEDFNASPPDDPEMWGMIITQK